MNWKAIRESQGISDSWSLHSDRHYDWIFCHRHIYLSLFHRHHRHVYKDLEHSEYTQGIIQVRFHTNSKKSEKYVYI